MEVCYLRGDCRSVDFGESAIDEVGPGIKYEEQEKVNGSIWVRLLIPQNTIWSSARFVMGKGNYLRTLMVLMFAKNVAVLDSFRKSLKLRKEVN